MKFYDHTPAAYSADCRPDCAGCAQKRRDEAEARHVEAIVKFVRAVRGDEHAERVRNDPDALEFWDVKIQDYLTD